MKTTELPIEKLTSSELHDQIRKVHDEMADRRFQRSRLTSTTPHERDMIRHHSKRINQLLERHGLIRYELRRRGERGAGL